MKLSDVTEFRGRHIVCRPDADETVLCMWFAQCDNDATTNVSHPILGQVPTCQRCADKVEACS